MKRIIAICLFRIMAGVAFVSAQPVNDSLKIDSCINRMAKQIAAYPQEKLYVHFDKSSYLAGDTIWFRTYLVHATFHTPILLSNYVYVELINPMGSVISRVQIEARKRIYQGYIPIADGLPDGDYTVRAYTAYMENVGSDHFFYRRINIVSPKWKNVQMRVKTELKKDKGAELRMVLNQGERTLLPAQIKWEYDKKLPVKLNKKEGQIITRIDKGKIKDNKSLILEMTDASGNRYAKFLPVSTDKEDYEVDFFPEGGYLLEGTPGRVAFKSLGTSGNSMDVSMEVRDEEGEVVGIGNTIREGMGMFEITPQKGKKYTAYCSNRYGIKKVFDLPVARDSLVGLEMDQVEEGFRVSLKEATYTLDGTLYLIAHVRGGIVFADRWQEREKSFVFDKRIFPPGVVQFLLLDGQLNPLSERLAFSDNYQMGTCRVQTRLSEYGERNPVTVSLSAFDSKGKPLKGTFSVSVTDTKEVPVDSSYCMAATLLLTSELKGTIENPASYLVKKNKRSLDLLMMIHGWRRYNLPAILKGNYESPTIEPERSMFVSGKTETRRPLIGGLVIGKWGKVSDRHVINIYGIGNTVGYWNMTTTDPDGRFRFDNLDFSENSGFRVEVAQVKGKKTDEIIIDLKDFPEVNYTFPQKSLLEDTLVNAEKEAYGTIKKLGERHYLLQEVDIKTPYWGTTNYELLSEKKACPYKNMEDLMSDLGIEYNEWGIYNLLYQRKPVTIFLDDEYCDSGSLMNWVNVGDIQDVVFLKDVNRSVLNALMKGNHANEIGYRSLDYVEYLTGIPNTKKYTNLPVLNITVKSEFDSRCFGYFTDLYLDAMQYSHNRKTVYPLGFQLPVEFYSPRYDTSSKRNSKVPDLRTTLFWKPDVKTDADGQGQFMFYTSDKPGNYYMVIEGISDNGEMVYQVEKIMR